MSRLRWEGDPDCPGFCRFCGAHRSLVRESGKSCCEKQGKDTLVEEVMAIQDGLRKAADLLETIKKDLAK